MAHISTLFYPPLAVVSIRIHRTFNYEGSSLSNTKNVFPVFQLMFHFYVLWIMSFSFSNCFSLDLITAANKTSLLSGFKISYWNLIDCDFAKLEELKEE